MQSNTEDRISKKVHAGLELMGEVRICPQTYNFQGVIRVFSLSIFIDRYILFDLIDRYFKGLGKES